MVPRNTMTAAMVTASLGDGTMIAVPGAMVDTSCTVRAQDCPTCHTRTTTAGASTLLLLDGSMVDK